MRPHLFFVLLLAVFAIVSCTSLSTAVGFSDPSKQDEEDRAFTWVSKLTNRFTKDPAKLEKIAKNKKYRQWLKDDETPLTMWAKLELTGQGPAWKLKNDPRFHEYLEFSALWRHKKGALAKEWWQVWRKNAW